MSLELQLVSTRWKFEIESGYDGKGSLLSLPGSPVRLCTGKPWRRRECLRRQLPKTTQSKALSFRNAYRYVYWFCSNLPRKPQQLATESFCALSALELVPPSSCVSRNALKCYQGVPVRSLNENITFSIHDLTYCMHVSRRAFGRIVRVLNVCSMPKLYSCALQPLEGTIDLFSNACFSCAQGKPVATRRRPSP